jgi:hypothetical protein
MLTGTYALTLVLSQVTLPLMAIVGLADVAFDLRKRLRAGGSPPRPV